MPNHLEITHIIKETLLVVIDSVFAFSPPPPTLTQLYKSNQHEKNFKLGSQLHGNMSHTSAGKGCYYRDDVNATTKMLCVMQCAETSYETHLSLLSAVWK